MNRELILEYAAKTERLGVPESWEATGRAAEPNCGDELVYYLSTKRDVVTEISYTITESACPPAKRRPCATTPRPAAACEIPDIKRSRM